QVAPSAPSGRRLAPSAPAPSALSAVPAPPALPASSTPISASESLASSAVSAEHVSARSSMVRVDFVQLDHLLNLVGELIIHRTKLHELGRELAEKPGGEREVPGLLSAVQQAAAGAPQLQETVMDLRIPPIAHARQ